MNHLSVTYLLASLPPLDPARPAPVAVAAFLERIRPHLSEPLYEAARQAATGDRPHPGRRNPLLEAYDRAIREAESRNLPYRTARFTALINGGQEPEPPAGSALWRAVDPLERDRYVFRHSWQEAGTCAMQDPEGAGRLLTYALRLFLLHHFAAGTADEGETVFRHHVRSLTSAALQPAGIPAEAV